MNKSRGFTIIELIVVIAIIAVLAAIVLVNVTGYINKGKDAAIKGNMATILTNSAIYYDSDATNKGSYTSFSGNVFYTAPATAIANSDKGSVAPIYFGNASTFCVTAPLNDGTTYCVDSTGYKGLLVSGKCAAAGGTCTS